MNKYDSLIVLGGGMVGVTADNLIEGLWLFMALAILGYGLLFGDD